MEEGCGEKRLRIADWRILRMAVSGRGGKMFDVWVWGQTFAVTFSLGEGLVVRVKKGVVWEFVLSAYFSMGRGDGFDLIWLFWITLTNSEIDYLFIYLWIVIRIRIGIGVSQRRNWFFINERPLTTWELESESESEIDESSVLTILHKK